MLHAGEGGKLAILCVLMCGVVVGGGTGSVAGPRCVPPLLSPPTQPTAFLQVLTKNSVPTFPSPFSVPQQEVLPNTSRSKKEGGRTPCSQYWLQGGAESGAEAGQAWAWHATLFTGQKPSPGRMNDFFDPIIGPLQLKNDPRRPAVLRALALERVAVPQAPGLQWLRCMHPTRGRLSIQGFQALTEGD